MKPKLICPECGSTDITIDDVAIDGNPEIGYEVFNAWCGDYPQNGHFFRVEYKLQLVETRRSP
jgi:hypothetical protein